ncbi:MAG: YhcH/YjgK/YiaL family protein [Muribaculaceae bacterium]|nr:YhcH/YjgK/YiaL family protein [Muribaculaceae bacterium]
MILCNIKDAGRYSALSPLMAKAIEWLKSYNPADFAEGKIDLGDGVVVKCQSPALLPREKSRLEVHKRFIDIQVPLKGVEVMGWAPVDTLRHPLVDYDEVKDVAFYGDTSTSLLHVNPGQMAVFFPEDGHAPNIGIGNHRKLVVKIPV